MDKIKNNVLFVKDLQCKDDMKHLLETYNQRILFVIRSQTEVFVCNINNNKQCVNSTIVQLLYSSKKKGFEDYFLLKN